MKTFALQKAPLRKWKDKLYTKRMCLQIIWKDLYPEYKELLTTDKKLNNPTSKWMKDLNKHFIKTRYVSG